MIRHLGTCGQEVRAQVWAQSSRGGRRQLRGEQGDCCLGGGVSTRDVLGPILLGEQHSPVGVDPQLCFQEGLGREAS